MRPSFNRQILASSKINNLNLQWTFVYHDIVGFQISVQYSELFVEVFHSEQDLPRYCFDFAGFVQSSFPTFESSLDKLSEIHVHRLEKDVQFTIVEVNMVRFHHVRAVRTRLTSFNFVKALQYSDFTLIIGFLFRTKFAFELFDGIVFARGNISATINMAKTSTSYYFV